MSILTRLAKTLFRDVIQSEVRAAAAANLPVATATGQPIATAIGARVDDSPGFTSLTAGTADRAWSDRAQDLEDALEAYRKNFLVRRLVVLTRSYVVGAGITLSSSIPEVDAFVQAFWRHPLNRMAERLGPMCDELTRNGELFPVLFTNRSDGMSYVRCVPAAQIIEVQTDPEDYERELSYTQQTQGEPRTWIGLAHRSAYRRLRGGSGGRLAPLMLHYAVNRPIGAVRGEGDLTPVLPWARRYSEWLADRVRLNRQRTRQGLMDLRVADDTMVEQKRQQLRTSNPVEAGIYVHGPGEEVAFHALDIRAGEAADDGRALRLAIASGANVALHYLGEGEATNYATAKEMGEPTARFFSERQDAFCQFLIDLTAAAYRRRCAALGQLLPSPDIGRGERAVLGARGEGFWVGGWGGLTASAAEVARADNQALAQAARNMAMALETLRKHGWIDDPSAVRLAFKFAGEPIGDGEIARILDGLAVLR